MKTTKQRIEEIKREGYDLDFTTVFGNAFENYKKIALMVGLFSLLLGLAFLVLFAVGFVLIYGMKDASFFENINPEAMQPENFSTPFLIAYIVAVVFLTALFSPITAGFIKMARDAAKGENISFGTAFEYYSAPFFKEIFVAIVILTFFTTTISILLTFVGIQFIGGIVSLIISFFTFLAIPFIIFGNLKAIEAIQASVTVVSKHILILLGLGIVGFLFSMMGMIACCIGIIFTMPIIYSLYYCIYDEIIGVYENEEGDDFHEIERLN